MISQAQARREVLEVEHQLRHARNRLQCYELLDDEGLAAATRALVASLEQTKLLLTSRLSAHV
jgi:hypothetical protein